MVKRVNNYPTKTKFIFSKILVSILILFIASDMLADSKYRIHERVIPPGHEKAFEFLELIKWPKEPTGSFNERNAPNWDLSNLLHFISDNGVTFTDVNGRLVGHLPKDRIKAQLL